MTTPAAAALYEAQHVHATAHLNNAVYNPSGKPIDELPVIYGFNNGGSDGWYPAVAIAQDGTLLGSHICSSEAYMRHDLGVLEGTRPDRHALYQNHYPDGYRMDFVPGADVLFHTELNAALAANKAAQAAAEEN